MARLNDPPQPSGETVESLRRKFIRQNRELARVNSTQSVRIRNLEAEVSRLLSENVTLREEVIRLNFELERRPAGEAWLRFRDLRQELGSRLSQLNVLLQELDTEQKKPPKRRPVRADSEGRTSPKQGRSVKARLNDGMNGDVEGKLPVILEDKCFPRQSLEARDVSNGLMDSGNLTDSPDLGPPPVSRLDEGDATETSPTESEANAPLNRKLGSRVSLDADARKKRRESFHQVNAAQTNAADGNANDPARDPVATQPLKSSAKRKFNVRDGEGKHPIPRDSSTQRQRQVAEKATDTTRSQETDRKRPGQHVVTRRDEVGTFGGNRTNAGGHRKPLGPKSVNSNLSSPVKKVQDTIKQERVSSQEDLVKPTRARGPSKESAPTMGSINFTTKDSNTAHNVELPPKTPAIEGLDLFSPSVSDPSERRPERGDTPPPPDLGADSTGSFGRGSRRSRGSVSYAEPNLRDKMRRPTKDLIDAVSTGERSRQAASNKRESEISSLEVDMAVLDIKSAAPLEVQPVWRTKPVQESRSQQERQRTETTSPLGKKATSPAAALPASVVTDRRRGSSSLSRRIDDGASMALGNGSGTSIAALSAASQRQQCKDNQLGGRGSVSDSASHDPLEANIFDFTSSSPEKHDKAGKQGEQAKPMRVSRRHSTVAALGEHGKGSLRISRRKRESAVESTEAIDSPASEESNSQPRQAQDVMAPEIESGGSTSRGTGRRRSMMI